MEKIRVVLVDDHPVVRAGIRMLIEQADDIEVVGEADGGERGLQLVEMLQPDVLLLDMEMPGKKGLDVARELQEKGATVRILALSAYDDEEFIRGVLSYGAAGYLTKEEALNKIIDAVRGVARGEEGWFSRRAARQMMMQARKSASDPMKLTEREKEILTVLTKGGTNKQIAKELFISERTVRFHLTNVYEKLCVSSRGEAIAWALKNGYG